MTNTIELTLEKTNELLDAAVAEKGADYVYELDGRRADDPGETGINCQYVHGDQPGCIVGNVLHRAGVPLSALSAIEGEGIRDIRLNALNVALADFVDSLLARAQTQQDNGATWGQAVARARQDLAADYGVEVGA